MDRPLEKLDELLALEHLVPIETRIVLSNLKYTFKSYITVFKFSNQNKAEVRQALINYRDNLRRNLDFLSTDALKQVEAAEKLLRLFDD